MQTRGVLVIACFIVLMAAFSPTMSVFAAPPLPSSFWGTVQVDGNNVPAGTVITLFINGVEYTQTTTQYWYGNSVYSLDITGDDTGTLDITEGGRANDALTFSIAGLSANQSSVWKSGVSTRLDLTALTTAPPEQNPQIVSVEPGSASRGAAATIAITGKNTNFSANSQVSFGADITVQSVDVLNSTQLTATILISSTAAPGSRKVTIFSGEEVVTQEDAFNIDAPTVEVRVMESVQGSASARVSIPVFVDTNMTGLGIDAYEFILHFDAGQLNPIGVSTLESLSSGWQVDRDFGQPGQVHIAARSLTPLEDQGTLLTLIFDVVGSVGTVGPLALSDLSFGRVVYLDTDAYNGLFEVIAQAYSVSGLVTYQETAEPVPGVNLVLSGTTVATAMTNAAGYYTLTVMASGDYRASLSKAGIVTQVVSAMDAALIAQHAAGTGAGFSTIQELACDLDNDGACSALDARAILNFLIGQGESQAKTATWDFYSLREPYQGLGADLINEDYKAYLYGDVTANWISQPQVEDNNLAVNDATFTEVAPGTLITIPVMVDNMDGLDITAYQGLLNFDPTVLTPLGLVQSGTLSEDWIIADNHSDRGVIRFAAYGFEPLEEEEPVVEFVFKVTGNPGQQTGLTLSNLQLNENEPLAPVSIGSVLVKRQELNSYKTFLACISFAVIR